MTQLVKIPITVGVTELECIISEKCTFTSRNVILRKQDLKFSISTQYYYATYLLFITTS
jgi:hypothetical protein